ncbi:MAG: hypothetical protein A2Y63_04800 [Candidatus Riflebacteria bacterium RBG_13_59_9]|nr:MAG: hypothetical protein A2Y63_04800 [Candidatus Riflebacteria bacterium RBG_13_59_9]
MQALQPKRQRIPVSQLPNDFIFGINTVGEALTAGGLRRLFVSAGDSKRLQKLVEEAQAAKIPVERLEDAPWFSALKEFAHQGVAGITRPFLGSLLGEVVPQLPETAAVLLVDGVNDPQNLGAVIRCAAAAGAAVVLPKHGVAPINATVHKVSAGATYRTPIILGENLAQSIAFLKKHGFWVAALDAHSGESMFSFEFPRRTAFIVGSEERGVRRLLKDKSDYRLTIPMQAGVESLNLGVSAALALFFFRAYWERGGSA